MSNTTRVLLEAGTAYPSLAPESTAGLLGRGVFFFCFCFFERGGAGVRGNRVALIFSFLLLLSYYTSLGS